MCRKGTFLPDLWDRLSFEVITLPPLRERPGDIPFLAHYFGARMAQELGREVSPIFTPEALLKLDDYHWPGNVRELKNVVERAVYRSADDEDMIGPEYISLDISLYVPEGSLAEEERGEERAEERIRERAGVGEKSSANCGAKLAFPLLPGQFDHLMNQRGLEIIDQALILSQHNQVKAAELLGLSYHRFRSVRRKLSQTSPKNEQE
jgi:psp operon transcriptional activator